MRAAVFRNSTMPAALARASAFVRGDEGAISVFFAICASAMVGTMCMSIGMIQWELLQARVQMALDVATLSSAANINHYATPKLTNKAQWQKDARAYYDANMPTGYEGLVMPDTNFSADISGDATSGFKINLSASGTMPILATRILGSIDKSTGTSSGSQLPDNQTVSASNAALYVPKTTVELVMVLDNTGSMGEYADAKDTSQGTKIEGLRAAAKNLVDALLPAGGTTSTNGNTIYVGLVPFTTVVNLKDVLAPSGIWLKKGSDYNYNGITMAPDPNVPGSGWGGCAVEPRVGGGKNLQAEAYAPASSPDFTPFFYNVPPQGFTIADFSSTKDSNGNTNSCTPAGTTIVNSVPLTLKQAASSSCGSSNDIPADWYGEKKDGAVSQVWGQNGQVNTNTLQQCDISKAVFLTGDNSKLSDSIAAMQPNGNTLVPTGILWGWRMLKGAWSNAASSGNGFISTDSNLPRPETGTPGLVRVAIILTDGENVVSATSPKMWPTGYFNSLSGVGRRDLTAPSVSRSGGGTLSSGDVNNVTDVNSFQSAVCTKMKDEGIIIYSITFGSVSTTAKNVMQGCATSAGYYYNAPSNNQLNTIFQQIAGNLNILRLTQ
jgi:hypothetical protein